MSYIIIKTTYPSHKKGEELAKILLKKKLSACIQILPISSQYIWQENLINSKEFLLFIKTKKEYYQKIAKIIENHHEYEVPQIISIKIDEISASYSNWIDKNLINSK